MRISWHLILFFFVGAIQALSYSGDKLLVVLPDSSDRESFSHLWSDFKCETEDLKPLLRGDYCLNLAD